MPLQSEHDVWYLFTNQASAGFWYFYMDYVLKGTYFCVLCDCKGLGIISGKLYFSSYEATIVSQFLTVFKTFWSSYIFPTDGHQLSESLGKYTVCQLLPEPSWRKDTYTQRRAREHRNHSQSFDITRKYTNF